MWIGPEPAFRRKTAGGVMVNPPRQAYNKHTGQLDTTATTIKLKIQRNTGAQTQDKTEHPRHQFTAMRTRALVYSHWAGRRAEVRPEPPWFAGPLHLVLPSQPCGVHLLFLGPHRPGGGKRIFHTMPVGELEDCGCFLCRWRLQVPKHVY